MERIFEEMIVKSKEQEQLLAIYCNEEKIDSFDVGVVIAHGYDTITMKTFNPDGSIGGIKIISVEEVIQIAVENNYLKKLEAKIENYAEIFAEFKNIEDFNGIPQGFEGILMKSMSENHLIQINFRYDLGIFGIVEDMDGDWFKIKEFDSFGEFDGVSVYKIEDVGAVNWDDDENRTVELLIRRKSTGDLRVN